MFENGETTKTTSRIEQLSTDPHTDPYTTTTTTANVTTKIAKSGSEWEWVIENMSVYYYYYIFCCFHGQLGTVDIKACTVTLYETSMSGGTCIPL